LNSSSILQRGRQGLNKRALWSTDSHRAVVHGDKAFRLLCANCSVIAIAKDTSINASRKSAASLPAACRSS
jgi:hypothetical protein